METLTEREKAREKSKGLLVGSSDWTRQCKKMFMS